MSKRISYQPSNFSHLLRANRALCDKQGLRRKATKDFTPIIASGFFSFFIANHPAVAQTIVHSDEKDSTSHLHHKSSASTHDVAAHSGSAHSQEHPAAHNAGHEAHTGVNASGTEYITVHHHHTSATRQAEAYLATIPGGTSIVDAATVLKTRNATNADVFKYQPGVFAQAPCGSDDLRISIRGSGIQTGLNATRAGIMFLFDGIPFTTPIGTFNELQEPLGIRYTEILRGGNGIDYGSTQLGGAINYTTQTGYNSDLYQARLEAGSFGYVKEQLSSGHVMGKSDYYLSVTNSYRAGYQENTKTTNFGVNFNYGYKFNDKVDNRFFFRYRQTSENNPFYLTRQQVAENPKQMAPAYRGLGTKTIEPGSEFIADKITFHVDDQSKLVTGFAYINAPMNHQLGTSSSRYYLSYATGTVDYQRHDSLLGHASDTDIGIYTSHDLQSRIEARVRIPSAFAAQGGGAFNQLITNSNLAASDTVFHVRNNTEVFKNFFLTAAGALTYNPRAGTQNFPEYSSFSQSSLFFAPRGGFRYVINPNVEFYGNVSRSVQQAQDWQYLAGTAYTSGLATGYPHEWEKLRPQTATTFEAGTTGHYLGTEWSVTYYHSAVHNELLQVATPEQVLLNTSSYGNASPTTHQGVETSFHSTLYQWQGNIISLRNAYTYQSFRFNHDATWGHNYIPGIPQHFYQGELHIDMKNGFYASVDAEVSSSVIASYDNRYKAAPYHIYNFDVGYLWPNKHRQVFLSLHNLANKHYATGVIPVASEANGNASAMLVGDGFGIFAGVSIGFN
ncbi:TonB-dependent receptor family protein [Acetobacter oeni]|uniref:TonB-dependent receptor family protein n=1 Tax=Acetobacter oeni TaxID=304077 RepID=UPI00184CEC42|nr:iron complex outermembrane receptor protein [Acetobacter oeni]